MKGNWLLAAVIFALVFCGVASAQTKKGAKQKQDPTQTQRLRAESQITVHVVEGVAIEMGLNKKQTEKLHRIAYFAEGKNPGDVDKMMAEGTDAKKNDLLVFAATRLLYVRLSEIMNPEPAPKQAPPRPPSYSEPNKTSTT